MSSELPPGAGRVGEALEGYQAAVDDFDREAARLLGINETDLRCLEILLREAPEATPRLLAGRLGLTTGSVTSMLDRLEKAGYLTRSPHPGDRRKVIVRATETAARRAWELMGPLVAAGEPFVAGFGVDPQLQVSRRLANKSRSIQGGNQIFDYEFRIGVRNYRTDAVKLQLWDRLPKPDGEAVAVNFVKASIDLSSDALYQRTARMDNLLRWDIDLPKGTVGDKTKYVNYEFRLEYARDFAPPRFVSGGLREGPIGGGAMGGMGGMGGGMRSVRPRGN